MAQKCVHKGCGKLFSDEGEPCVYHPGPPEFHEGQKGWKCCKPRVLTFDEFLAIPPCTTGKHSTVDDTPAIKPKPDISDTLSAGQRPASNGAPLPAPAPNRPQALPNNSQVPASPAPPESDSDEPTASPATNASCRRRGCNATYTPGTDRSSEDCVYHPGQALFHEGSKGWTCCKKRVLEFDEFMKIPGCKTRTRHCFVGKGKKSSDKVEELETVRHDFYQTGASVIASLYLKKVDKGRSKVAFASPTSLELDLNTTDGKRYAATVPLFGAIEPEKSTFRILGTKVELTLAKADLAGWPVLRSDERLTGEIIQTGRPGSA